MATSERQGPMAALNNQTDLFSETEAKYQGIFENAAAGIFQSTPSGTFITANPALARMLGYESPAELIATITNIQAQLYVEPERYPAAQLLEENDRQRFEVELYRKDGSTIWVAGNVRAVRDTHGQVLYYEGMAEDISERKQAEEEIQRRAEQLAVSEERMRLIVDSASDAFIAMDANGLITDWNHQAEITFGWPREEAIGQLLSAVIIPARYREAHQRGLRHFLTTGKGPLLNRRIEVIALHRDGHEFPVELTVTPIRWRDSFIFSAFVHDITERKHAEEAAKESEERLRLVFEAAKIGTGELDLQTNQITFSSALQQVVGLAPGTFHLTFEEYVERLHPEDRAHLSQVVENVIAGQSPKAGQPDIAVDYRIVWPDGSVHWTTSRAKVFYDEAGQARRIIAALIDITERKQAEEALQKAHQDYAALVNSIDGIVWEADAQTLTFNFVSHQAERLLGYPVERWLTEPTFWQDHIHPEDQAWAVNIYIKTIQEKRPHDFEFRMLAADGRVVWLRDIVTVVVENDQAVRLQGVMVNISETKRAEVLRNGQNQILEMIATNAPLEDVLVSLTRLIESQSEEVLCSILLLDNGQYVWHGAAPSLPEAYTRSIDGSAIGPQAGSCGTAIYWGEPVIVTDILHDPLWDDYRHLATPYGLRACWSTPIISSRGEALGSFAMYYREPRSPSSAERRLTDIATHLAGIAIERKRAEKELRQHREHLEELVIQRTAELAVAKDKAEEADRLKSAFLATMSHELRTPLNSIIGFTGIMLQGLAGPLNDEQQKQLNMVKSSARHLLNLINEVLDLSKIEAGQVEIHLEPFDMRALIEKTVQTLEPLAGKKALKLVVDVAPEVGVVISDWRRVEQILINLVSNAIKFTDKGQVCLECRPAEGRLLTRVVDTGIGIKPEDIAHLFTTFRQLDSTLARKHKGTGLGLAICKKLVDLLGGEIWAESVWGEGSIFTFTLPFNSKEEDNEEADSNHRG